MSLFDDPGLLTTLPEQDVGPPSAAAYRVLARKYRPSRFEDLIGQEVLVRILRNAFLLQRVAHAYMLTGVRGVGKTTTARIIARALNCVGPEGTGGPTADPCGVCANCVAILADRHPDVTEMDAASQTGVDDVREIIEATRFRPLQARTRVFIIDEVHMLTRHAFNALLKTLEEPPPHVKFVFATTDIRKVPLTVLSRCQRFDLRRVSIAELIDHFGRIANQENVVVEEDALALIARASEGSVRDGLSLLDQAMSQTASGETVNASGVSDMLGVSDRDSLFDLLEAAMAGEVAAMLDVTARAHERGADLGVVLSDLLDLIHTLTRLKMVPALRQSREMPEAERVRGGALADRLDTAQLARSWQMVLKGIKEVEIAPDRRAAAEMILIRLCHVSDLRPPAELVRRLEARPAVASLNQRPDEATAAAGARNGRGDGALARRLNPEHVVVLAPIEKSPAPAERVRVQPQAFTDVVRLVAASREATLHAHLLHSVHLVRFAPPVIELRPQPQAPRDLAARLGAVLLEATGTRWTIALSGAGGQDTLADEREALLESQRETAARHPLVLAIMAAFPGARIASLEASPVVPTPEEGAETRGALSGDAALEDGPGFAPEDAEPADGPRDEPE